MLWALEQCGDPVAVTAAVSETIVVGVLVLAFVVLEVTLYLWRSNRQGEWITGERQRAEAEARNAERHLEWSRQGFTYLEEREWEGLSPEAARRYKDEGKTPEEALRLLDEWSGDVGWHPGFTPEQEFKWKAAGWTPREARHLSQLSGDLDNPPKKSELGPKNT